MTVSPQIAILVQAGRTLCLHLSETTMFTFLSCLIATVTSGGISFLISRGFLRAAGNRPFTYLEARAMAIAMWSGSLLGVLTIVALDHFKVYAIQTMLPAMAASVIGGLISGYVGLFGSSNGNN